ncbi:MAG: hypothetical protein RR564_02520 [Eubacterium sp.]
MEENLHWEYDDFEFDNRVSNLMWTICGDYDEQMNIDEKTNLSKNIALYYGITAGGRRKHINWQQVNAYVGWRCTNGFKKDKLQSLLRLAMDQVVTEQLIKERPGVKDIQCEAAGELVELLEQPESKCFLDQVEFILFQLLSDGDTHAFSDEHVSFSRALRLLSSASDTLELLEGVDTLYRKMENLSNVPDFDRSAFLNFQHGDDVDTEAFIAKAVADLLKRDALNQSSDEEEEMMTEVAAAEVVYMDQAEIDNLHKQVEHFCGASFIEPYQLKKLKNQLCKGVHKDCHLHYTDGVLRSNCDGEFQRKYARRDQQRNKEAFDAKLRVYTRTIKRLRDALVRTLVAEREKYPVATDSGMIDAIKVWRVGKTACSRIFKRFESNDKGGFVVDLMIDSSTSQKGRESKVAIQAYIIARALVEAKIPCRVMGFNCFLDFTVLKRFRNYDDKLKETENIFEYYCEGSNRDGLAIKGVCHDLINRDEENKILIVLSDGKPNDIHLIKNSDKNPFRGEVAYSGGSAVGDTAKEVRIARQKGISVLGVFTGNESDLEAEKLIYGKDFIYTRNIYHFADIVTSYLKKIITH